MWNLSILEGYAAKIQDAANRKDFTPHEKYNAIFELVREIHCNSRMDGVQECKALIMRTIEKEI
mgnify:CR=1 FL=1